MDKEFAHLKALAVGAVTESHGGRDFVLGNIGGNDVVMMQCGIGKVNSAVGAAVLINGYSPDLVVSTGVAGGADVSLEVKDVVVSTACCYHDVYCGSECAYGQILGMPERFESPADIVAKAAAIDCGVRVHKGLVVSGDWFVDRREKMRGILDAFPDAVAVDMESCSIAQTCYIYGVKFVSFRIISDIPLKDHKAEMYYNFWDTMAEGSFSVTKAFLEEINK